MVDDAVVGARLFSSTLRLLRRRYDHEAAQGQLQDRIRRRADNFLDLVNTAIYPYPNSPYARLLTAAGCAPGDLDRLVAQDGVEGALQQLFRRGVYLTSDEAKGRREVVRGSLRFRVEPRMLQKPRAAADLLSSTSSSRTRRGTVPVSLGVLQESGSYDVLRHLGDDLVHAAWMPPGTNGLRLLVAFTLHGAPPRRWFSPVDPAAASLHPRYQWSAAAVRLAGLVDRVRLPGPEYVPVADPLPIVRWMNTVLRSGKRPCLRTFVTPAMRVCQAAEMAGVNLHGAHFWISGEPTTSARLAAIRRVGATYNTTYGATESGVLGIGCVAPQEPDEAHVPHEMLALTQPGADATAELPPQALLVSTLVLARARLTLINLSIGDQAELVQRDCQCPLEHEGRTTHVHTIRSFEKLTAGGMTLLDADVVRVLEETLPAHFGGGPTDYQLVEDLGAARVRLLAHPRLGLLDEVQVRQEFVKAMSGGSGAERITGLLWEGSELPIVERTAPLVTPGGKIQLVHRTGA